MTASEIAYRGTVKRLAYVLLIFEGLFLLFGGALSVLELFTATLGTRWGQVAYELLYGLLYAGIFIAPALLFRSISKGHPIQPMYLACRLPRQTPLYLFAGVAVITAAAYVNAYMVSFFDYGSFSQAVLWEQSVATNAELILMLFTTAVVPAFAEEFLFRGLILTNLMPYGRTTAVLASALLFGVMHQNIEQLFYATVAGVVLGLLYVKTRSLWSCILLHFVNNFSSVFQEVLSQRLPQDTAAAVVGIWQAMLLVLGVISALWLLLLQKDRKQAVRIGGCFEKTLPPDPDFAAITLPAVRRIRLFFNLPMVAFLVLCLVQMGSLVLLAMLML